MISGHFDHHECLAKMTDRGDRTTVRSEGTTVSVIHMGDHLRVTTYSNVTGEGHEHIVPCTKEDQS